jgi:hypothetical protein
MQAQHISGYHDQTAKGLDYARLCLIACDVPGQCDVRAMTHVINAHLRRHDTYRSWFEYQGSDLVRHTISDPKDIRLVPNMRGVMTSTELREFVLATPDPLQWDCFSFGIIQGPNKFTFFVSIDHLHMDGMFIGVILMEFQLMYAALAAGGAPISLPEPGSYYDFCARQHETLSALSLESPQVRQWVDFAENNDCCLPEFPLPLGDPSVPCKADFVSATVLDHHQTLRFESACVAAGARFIGGLFACAALTEHEITGADTYYGLTPVDTRTDPVEYGTLGWFTGLVPVTVSIGESFGDAASAAQESFDTGTGLANVPYYRVLELAPHLSWPRPNFPVINYFDASVGPIAPLLTASLDGLDVSVYGDGRYSYQLCIFVVRLEKETVVSIMFPENPIARESATQYLEALKSMLVRVASGHRVVPQRTGLPQSA